MVKSWDRNPNDPTGRWARDKYRKLKADCALRLTVARASRRLPRHDKKLLVSIERHAPRLLDADNVAGSYKPVLDVMVNMEWLVDDSPSHVETRYRQVQALKGAWRGTVVEICEL